MFTIDSRRNLKRRVRFQDDPDQEYVSEYTAQSFRVPGTTTWWESPSSPPKKHKTMATTGPGLPTQFHGVPLEERAIDSKGNRLPWALEYHE